MRYEFEGGYKETCMKCYSVSNLCKGIQSKMYSLQFITTALFGRLILVWITCGDTSLWPPCPMPRFERIHLCVRTQF